MADTSGAKQAQGGARFTPGPWHASERAPKHLGGVIVIHSSGAKPATGVAHAWSEADAALIAAAPELHDLLALAAEDPAALGLVPNSPWLEAVRAALAKAVQP